MFKVSSLFAVNKVSFNSSIIPKISAKTYFKESVCVCVYFVKWSSRWLTLDKCLFYWWQPIWLSRDINSKWCDDGDYPAKSPSPPLPLSQDPVNLSRETKLKMRLRYPVNMTGRNSRLSDTGVLVTSKVHHTCPETHPGEARLSLRGIPGSVISVWFPAACPKLETEYHIIEVRTSSTSVMWLAGGRAGWRKKMCQRHAGSNLSSVLYPTVYLLKNWTEFP